MRTRIWKSTVKGDKYLIYYIRLHVHLYICMHVCMYFKRSHEKLVWAKKSQQVRGNIKLRLKCHKRRYARQPTTQIGFYWAVVDIEWVNLKLFIAAGSFIVRRVYLHTMLALIRQFYYLTQDGGDICLMDKVHIECRKGNASRFGKL